MRISFLIFLCYLGTSWVSGEHDVSSSEAHIGAMPTDVPISRPNPKPLMAVKPTQAMRMNVPPVVAPVVIPVDQEMTETKTETKFDSFAMNPMQVTGFITANGTIYEVQDKNGIGQIEGRQNGELLTPQPGEYICNYGSVVLYSDMPCEQVAEHQKPTDMNMKAQKETIVKPMAMPMEIIKEKETSPLDIQADDNSNVMEHKNNNGTKISKPMKSSRKPGRKRGNKKNKKQKNSQKQNQNKRRHVIQRRIYKVKKLPGQEISQLQHQPQQPIDIQSTIQRQRQQNKQKQNKRRGQTNKNNNKNRRRQQQQQQQKRRIQQQQQNRRLQQNSGISEMKIKQHQRYTTANGLVYEIIDTNEN